MYTSETIYSICPQSLISSQTLMSTPIVNFKTDKSTFGVTNIGLGALKLYLVISLPLVLITLLAWGLFSLHEKRKERKKKREEEDTLPQ